MKVIGFVGSPRKDGNTDILVKQVLEGAVSCGAETEIYYVNEIPIRGCQACNQCKTLSECGQEDGMAPLYKQIHEADGIVIGTPVYFGQVSGQMKCFLDRWYAFLNPDFSSRIRPGKKIAFVYAHYDAHPRRYDDIASHFVETMNGFGFDVVETMPAYGLRSRRDAKKREVLMEKAFRIGAKLAGGI